MKLSGIGTFISLILFPLVAMAHGGPPAQSQIVLPSPGEAARAIAYVEKLSRECVVRTVLKDDRLADAIRDGDVSELITEAAYKDCVGPVSTVFNTYEWFYGTDEADRRFNGPFLIMITDEVEKEIPWAKYEVVPPKQPQKSAGH